MRVSFTEKVRQAAQRLKKRGEEPFGTGDVGHEMFIQTREDHKKMLNAVYELRKQDEIISVARGRYEYVPKSTRQLKDKLWRVVRAKRKFTLDDLVELTGAKRIYCKEFVALLIRRGIVRKITSPGVLAVYRMIEDPGPELEPDRDKADKLREIRERRKEWEAALAAAEQQLVEAQKSLASLKMSIERVE